METTIKMTHKELKTLEKPINMTHKEPKTLEKPIKTIKTMIFKLSPGATPPSGDGLKNYGFYGFYWFFQCFQLPKHANIGKTNKYDAQGAQNIGKTNKNHKNHDFQTISRRDTTIGRWFEKSWFLWFLLVFPRFSASKTRKHWKNQ